MVHSSNSFERAETRPNFAQGSEAGDSDALAKQSDRAPCTIAAGGEHEPMSGKRRQAECAIVLKPRQEPSTAVSCLEVIRAA